MHIFYLISVIVWRMLQMINQDNGFIENCFLQIPVLKNAMQEFVLEMYQDFTSTKRLDVVNFLPMVVVGEIQTTLHPQMIVLQIVEGHRNKQELDSEDLCRVILQHEQCLPASISRYSHTININISFSNSQYCFLIFQVK